MESGYRLRKELFAFEGNKVRFIFSGSCSCILLRHCCGGLIGGLVGRGRVGEGAQTGESR